jgi:hypothetical protein
MLPTGEQVRAAIEGRMPRLKGCRSGFLAGGSVASALLGMLDGKVYHFNDLDVFEPTGLPMPSWQRLPVVETRVVHGVQRMLVAGIATIETLLDEFDLNCAQAGIDLADNRLCLSPQFAEFICSRRIRLSRCSLGNTLVRAHERNERYKCGQDMSGTIHQEVAAFFHMSDPVSGIEPQLATLWPSNVRIWTGLAKTSREWWLRYRPAIERDFECLARNTWFPRMQYLAIKPKGHVPDISGGLRGQTYEDIGRWLRARALGGCR